MTGGRKVTDCRAFFFTGFCKTKDEPPRSCWSNRRRPQTLRRILWGGLSLEEEAFDFGKPRLTYEMESFNMAKEVYPT